MSIAFPSEKIERPWAVAVSLTVLLCLHSQCSAANPSLNQVISEIDSRWQQITAADIRLRYDGEEIVDKPSLERWLGKLGVRKGRERFAFSGGKRYYEWSGPVLGQSFRVSVRKINGRVQRVREPIRESTPRIETKVHAFNGRELRLLPSGSIATVASGTPDPKRPPSFESLYLRYIGFYIDDPTAGSEIKRLIHGGYVSESFRLAKHTVSEDTLSGVKCLLLEGRLGVRLPTKGQLMQRIWLDPALGYYVVRRDYIDPASAVVKTRVINSRPREVLPNVWVPMQTTITEFGPPDAPADLRNKPMAVTRITVTEFKIGKVDDDLFEIELAPGTLVTDISKGKLETYTVKQDPVPAAGTTNWPFLAAIIITGLVALAVIIIHCRHRRNTE